MTEQEVLQKLLDTNNLLLTMMTGSDTEEVEIDGVMHPTFKKYIKDTLLLDFNAIKDEAVQAKDEAVQAKQDTKALKANIETIQTDLQALATQVEADKQTTNNNVQATNDALFDMRQALATFKSYKKTINDYIGQLELELQDLNSRVSEAKQTVDSISDIVNVINQKAGEIKADKLTVVDYLSAQPNKPVNEYSYSNGALHKSPCTNFSMLHYLNLVMSSVADVTAQCGEYITLTLRDNTPSTVCIKGTVGANDEHIELELVTGVTENIGVRGNP